MFLSLFTGDYIDRSFSSSSGNIGVPRPRRSPRYPPTLPWPAVSICYFYIILLPLSLPPSLPPFLTIDHQPPPRIFSFRPSLSLSFHFVPLSISTSVSFSRFSILAVCAHTPHTVLLCFSLLPTRSSRLRRFSDPFSPSFSPPPLPSPRPLLVPRCPWQERGVVGGTRFNCVVIMFSGSFNYVGQRRSSTLYALRQWADYEKLSRTSNFRKNVVPAFEARIDKYFKMMRLWPFYPFIIHFLLFFFFLNK